MLSLEGWAMVVAGIVIGVVLCAHKILHSPWWVRVPLALLATSLVVHGATHLVEFETATVGYSEIGIAISLVLLCIAFSQLRIQESIKTRRLSVEENARMRRAIKRAVGREAGLVPGSLVLADSVLFLTVQGPLDAAKAAICAGKIVEYLHSKMSAGDIKAVALSHIGSYRIEVPLNNPGRRIFAR